ncbi:Ribulose bisphosphate carboxylase large chain [Trichinella pseudospiralis]
MQANILKFPTNQPAFSTSPQAQNVKAIIATMKTSEGWCTIGFTSFLTNLFRVNGTCNIFKCCFLDTQLAAQFWELAIFMITVGRLFPELSGLAI